MGRVKSKDTTPELAVRRALHSRGLRYRLHRRDLPGRPDLVLAKYRAAIFVHGCFWHGHECPMFRLPKSRTEFWRGKIRTNRARDHKVSKAMLESGWRCLTIWECAVTGQGRLQVGDLVQPQQVLEAGMTDIADAV